MKKFPIAKRNILETRSGIIIHVTRPRVLDFALEDIAFGLSNIARFAGQRPFYTVLDHTMAVFYHVSKLTQCPRTRLAALLHDAPEAYMSDVPSPVKKLCSDYQKIEKNFQKKIFAAFGLSPEIPFLVHAADDIALEEERAGHVKRSRPSDKKLREFFMSEVRTYEDLVEQLHMGGN